MSNLTNVGYRLWLSFIDMVIGFSLPFAVSAESTAPHIAPDVPPAPPAHLVRELLEEDARRALINERLSHASSAPAALGIATASPTLTVNAGLFEAGNSDSDVAVAPVKSAPSVRLKSIVGVGTQLSAIVNIDGQDVVYRAGQTQPALGPDKGLRLVKIATPCARFSDTRQDTATPLSVCLNEVHP
ncbi:MAG: hypothetical protein JHC61_10725 [Burkholderiaceae bacterium]|nr:hypothetical protein [Burkholderiaceae bacterium]